MILLPLLLLVAAGCFGWLADRAARAEAEPPGDSGWLWASVTGRFGCLMVPPAFVSGFIEELFPAFFRQGWHLHADRTGWPGASPAGLYPWLLAFPFVVWGLLVLAGLRGGSRQRARWLAGSAGLEPGRAWLVWPALPMLAFAALAMARLGGGQTAFPAANWSICCLFAGSLLGAAGSRGAAAATSAAGSVAGASPGSRQPWLQTLLARGFDLEPLTMLPASSAPPIAADGEIAQALERMGVQGAAPELIAAFESLMRPGREGAGRVLIEAPDHCGQVEATTVLALLLGRRFHEKTLVVVPGDAEELAERIRSWLPLPMAGVSGEPVVTVPRAAAPLPLQSTIWVTDLETLSNVILPRIALLRGSLRVGLVVWWDLHRLSGVPGASLWALSRRCHRLLTRPEGGEVRTAALLRWSRPDSQVSDFVRRVLPQDFRGHEVRVPFRVARHLHLFVLKSYRRYLESREELERRSRHPALSLARESIGAGWPTFLDPPPEVGAAAVADLRRLVASPAGSGLVAEKGAGASIQALGEADAMALAARFAEMGRAAAGPDHFVGLLPGVNPYLRYLLSNLGEDLHPRGLSANAGRRLICAAGNPRALERHLLLALAERPDTREGLRRDFLRQDDAIQRILDGLSQAGALGKREVRYLDHRRRLVIDHQFRSLEAAIESLRPLDTVGDQLIDLMDPAAGHEEKAGVLTRIDPERATVAAYPGRQFLCGGSAYEVQPWLSLDAVRRRGFIECRRVDHQAYTWRRRTSRVENVSEVSDAVEIHLPGRLLLARARLVYQEMVLGVVRKEPWVAGREVEGAVTQALPAPLLTSFATRGLLLLLPSPAEIPVLAACCEALRPLLPIHLGIAEDVLELVPLGGSPGGELALWPCGIALVELFPGGMGVLDAVAGIDRLIPELLERAWRWLDACDCGTETGCESCLQSPMTRAAAGESQVRREDALRVFAGLLGKRRER